MEQRSYWQVQHHPGSTFEQGLEHDRHILTTNPKAGGVASKTADQQQKENRICAEKSALE